MRRQLSRFDLRRESVFWDALAATIFAIGGVLDAVFSKHAKGPLAGDVAAALALAFLVLVRRRRPFETAMAALTVLAIEGLLLTPPPDLTLPFFVLLLFPYATGAHERGFRSWLPVALAPLVVIVVDIATDMFAFSEFVFPSAIALAAWVAGRTVRRRTELAVELQELALRAEEERESEARLAVAQERRRIAREMHDIVAHSISVMVVQAGGARRILDSDPARAVAAGAEIERYGREALHEIRRLLGAFRSDGAEAAREPAPSFEGVEALVETATSVASDASVSHRRLTFI